MDNKPVSSGAKLNSTALNRLYLGVEFILIFFGLPTLLAFHWAGASPIIFVLLAFLGMCAYLYFSKDFSNKSFFRISGTRREIKRILIIFLCLFPPLTIYLYLFHPDLILAFPLQEPKIYALVMVLYPVLSVYPQEVIFRGFLFTRYKPVLGAGTTMIICSGLAFGYSHIIFLNTLAVLFSTVGGILFALTYFRSRSLLLASIEHSLYGCFIFTIGLGRFFYHGAVDG